jgi:hypothetical protein
MHHSTGLAVDTISTQGSLTSTSNFLLSFQNCVFHSSLTSDLKAFTDKFGFDVLILFASYLSEEQLRQQIAVYSQNLELCSQVSPSSDPHLFHFILTCWLLGHVVRDRNRLVACKKLDQT